MLSILKTFLFGTSWFSSYLSQWQSALGFIWRIIPNETDFGSEKFPKYMEKSFLGDVFYSRKINFILFIEIIFQEILGGFSINEKFFFVATEKVLI